MRIQGPWSETPKAVEVLRDAPGSGREPSFAAELKNAVGQVNTLQNNAEKAMEDGALRGAVNIHESMIVLQEAEIGLKMLMRVRDKALEAYHEVMRMQF
ncbi:MAG: flagellar hook-basal body complex protein FliE [Desulfosoma sp.]